MHLTCLIGDRTRWRGAETVGFDILRFVQIVRTRPADRFRSGDRLALFRGRSVSVKARLPLLCLPFDHSGGGKSRVGHDSHRRFHLEVPEVDHLVAHGFRVNIRPISRPRWRFAGKAFSMPFCWV
jgi:hypothetical protein